MLAIRLVAQDTHVAVPTVTIALLVYVLGILTPFFLLVHRFRPHWLPLHQYLRRRPRYSRTHISHLRQDRAIKFGFPQKAVHNAPPSPPSIADDDSGEKDEIMPDLLAVSDDEDEDDNDWIIDDESGHESDGSVPGFVEVSDSESELEMSARSYRHSRGHCLASVSSKQFPQEEEEDLSRRRRRPAPG
ncbi:hypothetical protein B0H13DRAFT_1897660 [Mycena leptocephala]|nr:hypothetical protein B0H13DRAFT_1897660 [Mycena leptocephala]